MRIRKKVTTEKTVKSTTEKDPNLPVYEDQEKVTTEKTVKSTSEKDPNLPVYEDQEKSSTSEKSAQNENESKESDKSTSEVKTTEVSEDTKNDKTESVSSVTKQTRNSSSGQMILFDGSFDLPSGNINVTADSGEEYEIMGNTPLGLLQALVKDGKISSVFISDKGMNRAGILTVTGIQDYLYGEETWFAKVNEAQLNEFTNPGSDGWNLKKINAGDKVTFFYGRQDQNPDSAKAAIYVEL